MDVRLIVISDHVDEPETLVNAVNSSTLLVKLKYSEHTLDSLATEMETVAAEVHDWLSPAYYHSLTIRSQHIGSLMSVGFCDHGKPGSFCLLEGLDINSETIENFKVQAFFKRVAMLLHSSSARMDLLACNLTASEAGERLVARLEMLTGLRVCASNNVTGNGHLSASICKACGGIDRCC